MCGTAGVLRGTEFPSSASLAGAAQAMGAALRHRGPDDHGIWADGREGIVLAHRRLAILDLSPVGKQPKASADGRYVVTFNGEIYNFRELRGQLEKLGHRFHGASDTEVLVAAFRAWGVLEATKRLSGMFAFAVWDREERVLHLAGRDQGVLQLRRKVVEPAPRE